MAASPPSSMRSLRIALFRAVQQSLQNDVLDSAKATAYSGMLMLFPAFLVLTTLLALIPAGNTLLDAIRNASEQVLPADTMSLLLAYFQNQRAFSLQVILSAVSLSLFAAQGVMLTLMEGFRRAYQLPPAGQPGGWSFWQLRIRALLLVPIALVPLSLATSIVLFGHPIEFWMIQWMIANSDHGLHVYVLLLWRLARWTLALTTSTTVLGAVYHFGTRAQESWRRVVPGAFTATLLWFPATLAFGWYITRIADYTVIYGSLGTAIATLVWLYMTSFSVLLGAQLNGVLYCQRCVIAASLPPPAPSPAPEPTPAPAEEQATAAEPDTP